MDGRNHEAVWAEIDLGAIRHNFREIRRRVNAGTKIMGVVKADAYGHGALEVSRTLETAGADMLGVTTVKEGERLREDGITLPILVFAPFIPQEIKTVIRADLTVTVSSHEMVEWLKEFLERTGHRVGVHLKVETGMGRTGVWPEEAVSIAREIVSCNGLQLEGIYTHLATAMWKDKNYVRKQARVFEGVLRDFAAEGFPDMIRHIGNSAVVLDHPELYYDMVRTGTLLYGQYPAPHLEGRLNLKDPWSLKARVISLRDMPPGHPVGYGRTYVTRRKTRVAVLPVGFADGFEVEPIARPAGWADLLKRIAKLILQFFNHKWVRQYIYFKEGKGPVIGKVGMQLTMVDVTGIKDVAVGSTAVVPVRRTAVSAAVTRVYLNAEASQEAGKGESAESV